MKMSLEQIEEKIEAAELVLMGIGESFFAEKDTEKLRKAYAACAALLKGKNYFIISVCTDNLLQQADLKEDRMVFPLLEKEEKSKSWELYMKWLQGTLNKKLLVLEFGVGLRYPDLIRFPFEKVVYLNQKAELVRIHEMLYQLPEQLNGRGISIAENPISLLTDTKLNYKKNI